MSENYPSDVKLNDNPDGTVSFATDVVATIAGLAATEVDGVVSMISPSSGFADMFSRKNTRNFTKGVRIDLDESKVAVDITIVVDYGSPVPDVARSIQENVKKAIETMSGLEVRNVDVHVTGISFEREQRANAELDEQHRKMLERNEEKSAQKSVEAEVVDPEAEEAESESLFDVESVDEELGEKASDEDVVVEVQPVWTEPEAAAIEVEDEEDDDEIEDADALEDEADDPDAGIDDADDEDLPEVIDEKEELGK